VSAPKARSPELPGELMSTGPRASIPSVIATGPSQSVPQVSPAPPPIPPLISAFWQALLFRQS
jgi:hypothetical protein